MHSSGHDKKGDGRYDRQQRIAGWNQQALTQARVLVAGAGALGNEVIKNLALLGVGNLLVVDFDRVERSNLSRTVLFTESDLGRAKAEVAAAAAMRLNPEIKARPLDGDLFYDVGLGFYRHSDLVIGALDSIAARAQAGLSCSLAGAPFLDGGMWALGGEARWFLPGEGPCYACTLSEQDRAHAYERRSCSGFRLGEVNVGEPPVATTLSTAAIIGGLLAQEAVRYLCGWKVQEGEAIVYNGLTLTMHRAAFTRDPNCPHHAAYENVIALPAGPGEITALELLRRAEEELGTNVVLELGRDFLISLHCRHCNEQEAVNAVVARVEEGRLACPKCGSSRKAEIISSLDRGSAYVNRRLSELGIPLGDVVTIRNEVKMGWYELSSARE